MKATPWLTPVITIVLACTACSITSDSTKKEKKFSGILIDNFNSANGVALTKGLWYTYTDVSNKGESKITQDSIAQFYTTDSSGNQVYRYSYILDKGDNRWNPYVVSGVALVDSQLSSSKAPFMKGIAYEFKGSKHTLVFRSSLVTDYAHFQEVIPESETWTTIIVPYDDFKQPVYWGKRVAFDKSTIQGIEWMVTGASGDTGSIFIDNVRLLKNLPIKKEE
jgi:hypothetical protein